MIYKNIPLSTDDIFFIDNFLTNQECDMLLEEVKKSSPDQWVEHDPVSNIMLLKSKNHKLLISIINKIKTVFDDKLHVQIIKYIHKTDKDSIWELHKDAHTGNENIKYGVVIYLNDDFDGGLVEYPELKYFYKPKKGSLIAHSGNINHLVTKVSSGNRYTLTTFIRTQK